MKPPAIKQSIVTRTDIELTLTGQELIELINSQYGEKLPRNAEVSVYVPGGGDWSNTALSIDSISPIIIRWTETDTIEKVSP